MNRCQRCYVGSASILNSVHLMPAEFPRQASPVETCHQLFEKKNRTTSNSAFLHQYLRIKVAKKETGKDHQQ